MLSEHPTLVLELYDYFPDLISAAQVEQVFINFVIYLANLDKVIVTFSLFDIVTVIVYLVLVQLQVFFSCCLVRE
jgi:hypothetical protein